VSLIRRYKLLLVLFISCFTLFISVKAFDAYSDLYETDLITEYTNILDDTLLASNQFTQPDDLSVVDNFLDVPDTYMEVGDNEYYTLYMEEESYAIRVVNKVDGFIYGSSISDKDENLDNFNTTWEGIVNSCITVSYYLYNDTTGVYVTKEESLLKSEDSTSTYEMIENGFRASLYFGESQISMDLVVRLNGKYLEIEVPNESIKELEFELKSIKIYPFLGAVYSDSVPGYILVPDGSGALIRYQPIDVVTDIYNFSYYGQDDSIQTVQSYEPNISFSVSGMIHGINQHGFINIIEDGAAEATLVVSPAKKNLKYYYSYNEFNYRSLYQTPLSESDSLNASGRLVVEEDINDCNPVVKYMFLSGMDANYVGMANSYKSYLLDTSKIVDTVTDSSSNQIFIDVIAAESKAGFIIDEYVEMTDVDSLIAILTDLDDEGIETLVNYQGYSDGGVTKSGITYDSFNKKLGSLKTLLEYCSDEDIDIFFQIDPLIAYEDSSISIYRNVSTRINTNLNEYQGFNKAYYYLNPDSFIESATESVLGLSNLGIENITLDSIGNLLYSDYSDTSISRSAFIDIIDETLSQIENKLMVYQANDYLLKYTDNYLLMPLSTSRYRIYTDTVPFSAYVLSGIKDMYSGYMNLSSSSRVELLRLVDYGVYPSYIITDESAYALQDSELQQIYSSSYETWSERIKSDTAFIEEALESIHNAYVLSRTYITSGVYMITYSNGTVVYVNYANETYEDDLTDLEVDALSYKVVIEDA